MNQFKIHILFQFVNGPWGGGNQFLKSLRKHFETMGVYEDDPKGAAVILFNSHHCIDEVISIKRRYPDKIIVHRVDGPVFLVRGRDKEIDRMVFQINNLIADGTIFQSSWSRQRCYEHGMAETKYQEVIINAPNPEIFHAGEQRSLEDRKIRIVATSWSSNVKKGFDVYEFLDEHLDVSRYAMTFIGNSPITFKNIRQIEVLPSSQLADELRKHDIFLTASVDDPCSNSLIEALHCGLPAVVRNSGGHPEIVDEQGIVFQGREDILKTLDIISDNYQKYVEKLNPLGIRDIGAKYYRLAEKVFVDVDNENYVTKKLPLISASKFLLRLKLRSLKVLYQELTQ